MYNILEKVFFGDTLVLKFRNIEFWNDLIIGGVKYMYEQDYIIRMNNEVIRTMVKLLLNKDTGVPISLFNNNFTIVLITSLFILII